MAGIIVPIVEKRIFDYGFLTSGSQDVVLHPAVDVGNWYRVKIIVLIHQILATSGNFTVRLQNTFPVEQDRQEFVDTSGFLATSSITSASPNIQVSSTGSDPQAYLKVILRASQVTSGTPLYGEFSVFLSLREG